MSNANPSKNGKIELYRFLFCICVLMFHLQKYFVGEPSLRDGIHLAFFPHGSVAVEFFFVLSGYLMARSVYRARQKDPTQTDRFTASDGLLFLKRKYLSIFPQHLVAFLPALIAYILYKNFNLANAVLAAVKSIPNLFLIQMSGISLTNPNHVEWYISCMLIASAFLYPFLKKHYDPFSKYAAPLIALGILGYLYYNTKSLTGVNVWMGFTYKSMLRAIAELLLGITGFEVSRHMAETAFTVRQKVLLTGLELVCFLLVMGYILLTMGKEYEIYALALMWMLVVLAFSGATYGNSFFQNKFIYTLGKLSLPVYLSQMTAIWLGQKYFDALSSAQRIAAGTLITAVLAVVVMFLGDKLSQVISGQPCISKRRKS